MRSSPVAVLLAFLLCGAVASAQTEEAAKPGQTNSASSAKAAPQPRGEPKAKAESVTKPEPAPKGKPDPAAARPKPETPKAKPARAPTVAYPIIEHEGGSAGRAVRVSLLDGSSVVGLVRAEQADALVIDCSLGQLSIPRTRIATIAYDAAAQVGTKRAPVQQLDDDSFSPGSKSEP
jgi:hypothetical protein